MPLLKHPNELVRRTAAIDVARGKFEGKGLEWGVTDCARLAACVMQSLGLKPGLSKFGRYTSPTTALRRLREKGMRRVEDWLDGIDGLERRPFAFALPGDILAVPSDVADWPALGVFCGGDAAFLFYPEHEAEPSNHVCRMGKLNGAPLICWRITCQAQS